MEYYEYTDEMNGDAFDGLSAFNHRTNTHAPSKRIELTGSEIFNIIANLESDTYVDNRKPIDFSASYRTITSLDGSTRSVPLGGIVYPEIPPTVSGIIDICGYKIEYLFKSYSDIWYLLIDGLRYVIGINDRKPYAFSLYQKTRDGICVFGAYNGQRYHKKLLSLLNLKIKGNILSTKQLHPDNYHSVDSWRLNHDINEFYKPEENWSLTIRNKKYYVIVPNNDSFLKSQGLAKILKFDSIDLLAIPEFSELDSEGYYREVVTIKIRKGQNKRVVNDHITWYDALQMMPVNSKLTKKGWKKNK